MENDEFNVYFQHRPSYPTKEIDALFEQALFKKKKSKSPGKKGSKAKKGEKAEKDNKDKTADSKLGSGPSSPANAREESKATE